MARSPKKNGATKKPNPARRRTNKAPCECRDEPGKVEAGKKKSRKGRKPKVGDPPVQPLDCFPLCGEAGTWGIIWKDAAGAPRCLPFSGTGTKVLKADGNGPFWANE